MEHLGCRLRSDFKDYYDHELFTTEFSYEVDFFRFKNGKKIDVFCDSFFKNAGIPVVGDVDGLEIELDTDLGNIVFIRYFHIGHLGVWFKVKDDGGLELILKNKPLPAKMLRFILKPLYSIDFKVCDKKLFASSVEFCPILKSTPIESHFTAVEIANAIITSLDTSPNVLDDKLDDEIK